MLEGAQHHERTDQHYAMDGVGARHQRRVQGVGHLRDDGEPDEPGQQQDRQVGQQLVVHHFSPASFSPASRVTHEAATTSSSKSGARFPSVTSSSNSAVTFLEWSSVACSGIVAGRFSGETIVTSCLTTVRPGSVSSQLPPASPARSTTTLPGACPATAPAVPSRGAARPGTSAVVITTSNPVIACSSFFCCWARSSSVSSRAYPPSPAASIPRSSQCAPTDWTCSATSGRTS